MCIRSFPILLLFLLTACSDLSVHHRIAEPSAATAPSLYAFEHPALVSAPNVSEDSVYLNTLIRSAISDSLDANDYRAAEKPSFLVDFAVTELDGVMAAASLSPTSVRDSWRSDGVYAASAPNPDNPMDHRVARSDFNSVIQITVLMRDAASGTIVWEGYARQTLPERRPRGFERKVRSMVRLIVDGFPQSVER